MLSMVSDILYYWLMPVLWFLAMVTLSGGLGSADNTRQVLQWLLAGFVAVEPVQLEGINFWLRKSAHILSFALLFSLWFRAFYRHLGVRRGASILLTLILCLGAGIIDEWHQTFFPSRHGRLVDIMLDLCGSGFMALLTFWGWVCQSRVDAGDFSKTRLF
jgi:VanZ family protein